MTWNTMSELVEEHTLVISGNLPSLTNEELIELLSLENGTLHPRLSVFFAITKEQTARATTT